jgi:3-oxoacyl-[acyl-carrier protein] reductase
MSAPVRRLAVVTGAGRLRGVGAAVARRLAERNLCEDLLLASRGSRPDEARQITEELTAGGRRAVHRSCDLSTLAGCTALRTEATETFGASQLAVLVHCVGWTDQSVPSSYKKQVGLLQARSFEQGFAANCLSGFLLAQAFEDALRRSGRGLPLVGTADSPLVSGKGDGPASSASALIFVGSTAGITGQGSNMPYVVGKGAMNALALALAKALAPEVRVNVLCPGFIDSSWWEPADGGQGAGDEVSAHRFPRATAKETVTFVSRARAVKEHLHAQGRVLSPEDVAQGVVGLAEARGVSGEVVRMDFGMLRFAPTTP